MKSMIKISTLSLLYMATTFMFLLNGCANTKVEPSQSDAIPSMTVSKNSLPKNLTFGMIYPMTYPAYEMITQDASSLADKYNIKLVVNAPDEPSTEQQIRIMESMIKQHVDAIAISPVDSAALTPIINQAVTAGIPVVTFESDAPQSLRTAYVGADNYETGQQAARTISNLLDHKGMIFVENGIEDMLSMKQRLQGFLDYLHHESSIVVLDVRHNQGSESIATEHIESMIEAHPHFDAMVGLDFVSASASTLIWKAKGLNRNVVSTGVTTASNEALINGQITAVISQNEDRWGAFIMDTLLKASQDKQVDHWIDTETLKLTQETVNK